VVEMASGRISAIFVFDIRRCMLWRRCERARGGKLVDFVTYLLNLLHAASTFVTKLIKLHEFKTEHSLCRTELRVRFRICNNDKFYFQNAIVVVVFLKVHITIEYVA